MRIDNFINKNKTKIKVKTKKIVIICGTINKREKNVFQSIESSLDQKDTMKKKR